MNVRSADSNGSETRLHPKPQTQPIAVHDVCGEERGKKYVNFRNKGGGLLNSWSGSDRPLPTIMKGNGVQYYAEKRQYVSLDVLIPCASFPKQFVFVGSNHDKIARIGNSVPPNLMKAIAENIRNFDFMKQVAKPTVISTFAGCG